MLTTPISRKKRRGEKSSALVIVLFFVMLLSVVAIAFLSRSLTAVKVSSGSTGETKSKILAASASDIIIGDLKQEIIAGSTNTATPSNPNSGAVNWPVYTPTSNLTMIPFMDGVPVSNGTNAIPNLISRSVSPANTGGSAPYTTYPSGYYMSTLTPTNRAAYDSTANGVYTSSKVNSSTASLNGRYVSPAQWNSHYLIPRATPANPSTTTDATPVTTFVPPDWVVVTRGGVSSVTWPATFSGGISDSTLTNTNYAIGRYAYAIYNEGGLLDMNAAGYPADVNPASATTPPFNTAGPNGLTSAQSSEKVGLSTADLTQLAANSVNMTQAQINNIVGWRNYASAELTSSNGSYGSFAFTSATASNWLTNFVMGNTNGFLQVIPPPSGVTTPPTDQAFLSRQQLISVTQSLSISPDFLQYMGTFSRALEQPSTVPNPSRPKILTGAPPLASAVDSYLGNNDGQGGDTDPTGINPSFLAIRVPSGASWTRWNGVTVVPGEPLVKTKFALSWLAMVAYNATNTSLPAGFAKTGSDPDPIKDRFGLTRSSASSPWVYNHGSNSILTLSAVAALSGANAREPDFAELLKAAIIAGSLGKAAPGLPNTSGNYQYTVDSQMDIQVLQIMANLIDQQDTDSYPTVIQIGSFTVYGVEDLPYFYRYHLFSVVHTLPSPLLSNAGPGVSITPTSTTATCSATNAQTGATTTGSWSIAYAANYPAAEANATLSNAGQCTLLYIPELWNPHDMNALVANSTNPNAATPLRPANFRIYVTTDDPINATTAWNVGAESQMGLGSGNTTPNPTASPPVAGSSQFIPEKNGYVYNWPISVPAAFVAPASFNSTANNIMYFSDAGGTLFREPTLLWNQTYPTGINLSGPSVTDANISGRTYYGIIAGQAPISVQVQITSTPANPISSGGPDGNYVVQGNTITTVAYLPVSSSAVQQLTFYLQYQDPNNSSNWITYDVKYPDLHGLAGPTIVANTTTDYPDYLNPLQTNQFNSHAAGFDPRNARWGVGTASSLGQVSLNTSGSSTGATTYLLEPNANADFAKTDASLLATNFTVLETNRPRADKCNQVNYSNPGMTSNPGKMLQMRLFSGTGFNAAGGSGDATTPLEWDGLLSENNPAITLLGRAPGNTAGQQLYFEDADGVARRAMGAYADTTLTDASTSSLAQAITASGSPTRIGLPMATADTFPGNNGVATALQQSQSRPIVLNRPFRSVSEMSYAFRGSPWKNINFFTPESGDSALLDTFCLTEPPPNAMVAGKVDLNTRQTPVLQALVAGAYRDEINNAAATTTLPTYAEPPLSGGSASEASAIATTLETITSDTTHAWRGPLQNISGLVGRYVATPTGTTDTDFYTYAPPTLLSGTALPSVSYAGLSSALDCSVWLGNNSGNHVYSSNTTNSANTVTPIIQRMREAAIRPLAAAGQVRVWNLLIDVVAQTGRYPKTATGFDQFLVDGQTRLWVHVAIDRYTGQVIDKQVEVVTP